MVRCVRIRKSRNYRPGQVLVPLINTFDFILTKLYPVLILSCLNLFKIVTENCLSFILAYYLCTKPNILMRDLTVRNLLLLCFNIYTSSNRIDNWDASSQKPKYLLHCCFHSGGLLRWLVVSRVVQKPSWPVSVLAKEYMRLLIVIMSIPLFLKICLRASLYILIVLYIKLFEKVGNGSLLIMPVNSVVLSSHVIPSFTSMIFYLLFISNSESYLFLCLWVRSTFSSFSTYMYFTILSPVTVPACTFLTLGSG